MPSDPTFNEATEALDRIEQDAERAAMREVWNARHPATPSAPTPAMSDGGNHDALNIINRFLGYRGRVGLLESEAVIVRDEILRLRSSPGATPTDEPDWQCTAQRSHGPCHLANAADQESCGACGADRPPSTHSRDAALGAAVRTALAEGERGSLLIEMWDPYFPDVTRSDAGVPTRSDATRALASQLRAVTTEETT